MKLTLLQARRICLNRRNRNGTVATPAKLVTAFILSLSLLPVFAQSSSTTEPSQQPSSEQKPAAEQKPMTPAEKRKAELQADTEKLYKLTQELKAEVDKSNKDTLSVAVIKKAQEVERLAKSIKERSRQQ